MKLSSEIKNSLSKEEYRYYKQHGSLPTRFLNKNEPVVSKSVTVLCVRFGNKYGVEYVERLRNMVARHMKKPYEFACLTDDPNTISRVRTVYQKNAGYHKPWWHKVHMFDPNLDLGEKILYLDLDVVLCNNIDKLITDSSNNFMGIQDFNRKFYPSWSYLNSSVMSWNHRSQSEIWEKFKSNPSNAQRMQGDQDWIWHIAKSRIKFWPKEWIQSYKWEIRSKEELVHRTGKNGFKFIESNVKIHPECSIAVFHGDPKPEEIKDPFVTENWK